MSRKKLTANQKAWQKEVNRLNRYINQGINQGFKFNLKQYDFNTDMPARVTKKMLKRLGAIKPRHLYSESTYINPDTLKEVSGAEAKKRIDKQKREARKRAKQTKDYKFNNESDFKYSTIALQRVRELIRSWRPQTNWSTYWEQQKQDDLDLLERMLDRRISEVGEVAVSQALEKELSRVEMIVDQIMYASNREAVSSAFNEIAEILMGRSLTLEESIAVTMYGDTM